VAPPRGADLRYDLRLSFHEAVFGTEKELEIPRLDTCEACAGSGAEPGTAPITCPQCNGSGEIRRMQQSLFGRLVNVMPCDRCRGEGRIVSTPCSKCHGQGRVHAVRRLRVTIPAGVEDGTQVRLANEGEAGPKGGRPGNLFVVISVAEHHDFKRQGNDILFDLTVNIAQAALGDEVEVPTVDGDRVKVRIPPGTQNGKVIRLKDRGVPHLRGSGRGDMLIRVRVAIPTHLNDEQRHLLLELAKSFGTPISHDGHSFFDKVKKGVFGGD
jgi:molecular chaperone DnaJ